MTSEGLQCGHCGHEPCAHRVQIFRGLNSGELQKVARLIVRKRFAKGAFILLEGSELDSLIIINRGQVKAFRDTAEGKEQILYIFSEGDFFGEKHLLQKSRLASYHVQALEDTHLCIIRKQDFQPMLRSIPGIALKVLEELCDRLDRLEHAIEAMGTGSVEARIALVLLEFAARYGQSTPRGLLIELPLSREGIANYVGLTRETVSRKMSLLQEIGILEMIGNKKILLKNLEALRAYLG